MFTVSSVLLFASGTCLVLVVPGPTNTLLATAGFAHGLRHGMRFAGIELAGYLVSITLWGALLGHAAHALPWLPVWVRLASSAYMAWLAVRMWRAALALPAAGQATLQPRTLLVATLLNPKAMLLAGSIFPAAAFVSISHWSATMAIFALLLVPCAIVWIALGAGLRSGRFGRPSPLCVQRGASVILGVFSMSLAWTALR